MKTARDWKKYYADERERLGPAGLRACLDRAEALEHLPAAGAGALVFPHTRLEASGELAAAAALAVLQAGCAEVLALGVLHGGREADATQVQRARQGDPGAIKTLRRVHGPGVPSDGGHWEEEFSLDNFGALLAEAARREGKHPPRIIARFPFLAGAAPENLPGLDELASWISRGAALVATADPIHHGAGYGTPPADCLPLDDPRTFDSARATMERSFALLARRDYAGFLQDAALVRSDFRDAGPVLAQLLPGERLHATVHHLKLVDYSAALAAPPPTWVTGALASFSSIPTPC